MLFPAANALGTTSRDYHGHCNIAINIPMPSTNPACQRPTERTWSFARIGTSKEARAVNYQTMPSSYQFLLVLAKQVAAWSVLPATAVLRQSCSTYR